MSKHAPTARSALTALVLMLLAVPFEVSAAEPSQAAEAAPGSPATPAAEGTPAPEPVRPPGFACNDKALTGTGPGFDSSRDHSEQTAKEAWLEKARTIYTDAAWETAKGLNVTCVKQGLYSKCFASAVPCGVQKSSAAAEPAKGN
ncbi:MAG: hypothetical protein ACXWJN_02335 [Methyloceanibacter sp.]